MASPLDFLTGKTKKPEIIGPVQQEREQTRITAATCVHLDNSPANYGGNQSGGIGQDSEDRAFEQFLQRSREQVDEFNERLANEQTKQSQGSTRH